MKREPSKTVEVTDPRRHASGTRPILREREPRAGTYLVREPRDPREYQAMHRLRYDAYVEMGSFQASDFPNGLEVDAYDPSAKHFIACIDDHIMGTLRLTLQRDGKFLMESGSDGEPLPAWVPRERSCEPSRLVAKSFFDPMTGTRVKQYPRLFQAACEWSYLHGYTHWPIALVEGLYQKVRKDGWPLRTLGSTKTYHGARVVPVVVRVDELRSRMFCDVTK